MTALGWLLAGLILVALTAALWTLRRRADRRAEDFLDAVAQECARRRFSLLRDEPLIVERGDVRLLLPRRRLLRLSGEPVEAVCTAIASLLADPPAPLRGSLSLKIHGPRIEPRLRDSLLFELIAREPALALDQVPGLAVHTVYAVDGDLGACVTLDQLQEAGVDRRDLQGIALAVARQRIDEEVLRATAADGGTSLDLESAEAAGWLLVGSDFLHDRERLEIELVGARRAGFPPEPNRPVTIEIRREGRTIL